MQQLLTQRLHLSKRPDNSVGPIGPGTAPLLGWSRPDRTDRTDFP